MVSSHGFVKSFHKGKVKLLTLNQTSDGYYMTQLWNNDGSKRFYRTHRLVAEEFCNNPNPTTHTYVNHKDGNKRNNHASNLEWVTPSQNSKHSWKTRR